MPTLDDVLKPAPTVVTRQTEGELVVVLPDQGRFVVLNGTGASIWGLLDGRRQLRDVAAALSREYEVLPEQVESDVQQLAAALLAKGALVTIG